MKDNDIIAEPWAWRDEFARSHRYNIGTMVAALREMEVAAGTPLVRGEPRRPRITPPVEPGSPDPSRRQTGAA